MLQGMLRQDRASTTVSIGKHQVKVMSRNHMIAAH